MGPVSSAADLMMIAWLPKKNLDLVTTSKLGMAAQTD